MREERTRTVSARGVGGMSRRVLLMSAVTVAAGAGTARAVGAGEVPALWREFSRTPFTHPQIPYIGRAGCYGGAVRLPRRPVVADVRDFGAVADGTTDSAPAINRAIAAAGRAGGGTVTIPPGTFRIDDSATVGISDVTEFDQIDVPDVTGDLHTRLELYGSPDAVRPRNLYAAQRELGVER